MSRRVVPIAMTVLIGGVASANSSDPGATPIGSVYARARTELSGGWRYIVEVPATYVHDFWIAYRAEGGGVLTGSLALDGTQRAHGEVRIEIPELSIAETVHTGDDGTASFAISSPSIELWSPEHPKLYTVTVSSAFDSVSDEIGFRTVATRGHDILLNGEPISLRGISIHEEPIGPVGGRGLDWEPAEKPLRLARDELGCNFVRLAHCPHSEKMTRLADRLGLLVWSEVPVYWAVAYSDMRTRELAVNMITENVMRDWYATINASHAAGGS